MIDIFGSVLSALRSSRRSGVFPGSGWFANQNPPGYITGAYYTPIGYMQGSAAVATTATRCSYVPLAIWANKTFAGVSFYNTSAADTGKKIRIMVFRDDGAAGGPGTLVKDFGEVTLTAAAALRTLGSSWAATPGTYWLAFWGDSSVGVECMVPFGLESLAGFGFGPAITHFIGNLSAPGTGGTGDLHVFAHYVDTTYGAAPATAVAPTTSQASRPNTTAGVGGTPAVWLKG